MEKILELYGSSIVAVIYLSAMAGIFSAMLAAVS